MESHIKVARAHRALSWLYGLIAALGLFTTAAMIRHGVSAVAWMPSLIMFIFFFALTMLHHFTAKGARDLKPWANTTSKVIGILMLIGIPIGTLIGIYLLVNNDWRAPPRRGGSLADAWPVQTEADGGS